jgi:outer membrane receptor protein involved in Fe transport
VDVSAVERVEVVRGPASVLYGTDAIGGVVNIITEPAETDALHGLFRYRYGSEADQHKGTLRLYGGFGKWDVSVGGSYRDAGLYRAPAGTFGDIKLDDGADVQNTGVKDLSLDLRVGYRIASNHRVFGKLERYDADDAGFGYVDPALYAPGAPEIEILYPFQDFTKFSAGYSASELGTAVADRLDVLAYAQRNERRLDFNLWTSFGIPNMPEAGVRIATENYTDIKTTGFRIEAKKLAASPLLLTYGVDFFRDDSENSDVSTSTVFGFGPPTPEVDSMPQLPYATYRAIGVFAQGELSLGSRATIIAGARYQDILAQTEQTPGLEFDPVSDENRTVVGAVNGIYEVTNGLSVVGTLGRGFRAPNLIELFFQGATPEGGAVQVRNPDLKPEKSFNVDLGLRYRSSWVSAEGFVFRNKVSDGIAIAPTGEEINDLPVFTNVNVDELLYRGVELSADFFLPASFTVGGTFSSLNAEDALDPDNPIGESYSTKITGRARWDDPGDRFWVEYGLRHNGDQKDAALADNPIGPILPAFTVHDIRAGLTVWRTRTGQPQRLVFAVRNITDELYAEFTNASFFRPEPGRSITLTLELAF